MRTIVEWLDTMRRSSYVERVHTVPTIGNQNLGHHAYNVTILALAISEGHASAELLKACLYHDVHELDHGDPPGHTVWANEDLRRAYKRMQKDFNKYYDIDLDLNDKERLILNWADKSEFVLYCSDQLQMGNNNMRNPLERGLFNIRTFTHVGETPMLLEYLEEIAAVYGIHCN